MDKRLDIAWGSPPGKKSLSFGHCPNAQMGRTPLPKLISTLLKNYFPQKLTYILTTQSGTFRGQSQGHSKSHQNDLWQVSTIILIYFTPQLSTFLLRISEKVIRIAYGFFEQCPKERVFLLGRLTWNQCHQWWCNANIFLFLIKSFNELSHIYLAYRSWSLFSIAICIYFEGRAN